MVAPIDEKMMKSCSDDMVMCKEEQLIHKSGRMIWFKLRKWREREREREREGGREEDLNNTSKRSKNNILTKGVTEGIILDRIYWQRRIQMTVFD